jgi:hypothetical protein
MGASENIANYNKPKANIVWLWELSLLWSFLFLANYSLGNEVFSNNNISFREAWSVNP